MPLAIAERQQIADRRRSWATLGVRTDEVTVFCPACKTMETIFLENYRLMPTQPFHQRGSHISHNCGSDKPCTLYGLF